MVNSFLDPFLGWLLVLHPALGILLIALLVSIIVTSAIKIFTDQSLMKDLKSELKELQQQMKDLKNKPNKLAKVNERFMETNMKYMTHSMRPTLFTFIPIILVFGWLNSHIGYYPLQPNEPFELIAQFSEQGDTASLEVADGLTILDEQTKEVDREQKKWILQGDAGEYIVNLKYKGETYPKEVIVTEDRRYATVEETFSTGFFIFADPEPVASIQLDNEKIQPFTDVPVMQDIPWVSGWGWLGAYLFFSIIFSLTLRKAFNVY